MTAKRLFLAAFGLFPLLAVSPAFGQGMMNGGGMGPGMMSGGGPGGPVAGVSMVRHRYYRRHGLPSAYARLANPLRPTKAVLTEGAELYQANCASCHGASGQGEGAAGKALSPPAADLTAAAGRPGLPDRYFYWTIAEGGVPVDSAMPAYKTTLKAGQIWSLVTWLKAGLPSETP